jgi:hypothetical protein
MSEGNTLWAWQVQEPDGQWSMVGALMIAPLIEDTGTSTHMPLIHRKREVVMMMEEMAKGHARATGQPLRLAQFTLAAHVPVAL